MQELRPAHFHDQIQQAIRQRLERCGSLSGPYGALHSFVARLLSSKVWYQLEALLGCIKPRSVERRRTAGDIFRPASALGAA